MTNGVVGMANVVVGMANEAAGLATIPRGRSPLRPNACNGPDAHLRETIGFCP